MKLKREAAGAKMLHTRFLDRPRNKTLSSWIDRPKLSVPALDNGALTTEVLCVYIVLRAFRKVACLAKRVCRSGQTPTINIVPKHSP